MDGSLYLFDNLGQIPDRFVLEADAALGLTGRKQPKTGQRKLLRTLLIAAAITALLEATAYTMGLLGLSERIFPVEGTEKVVVVPNGLKGTKTYEGTGEWWIWQDKHQYDTWDYSLSFLRGNDRKRRTCQFYRAWTPEAADKLYEIAETYGLTLYSESLSADSMERLTSYTGIRPFLTEGELLLSHAYVFPDGSFSAEGSLKLEECSLSCVLQRFSTGALYPYGAVTRLPETSERYFVTAKGQTVSIVRFPDRLEIWYLSADGETFVALQLRELPGKAGIQDWDALAETAADRIDFAALCEKNDAVQQIVSVPRGAEDNREAARRLEDFYNSPMFCAAREFQTFFTENFHGSSFTGVYGQEGYEDIDAELARLAEQYGLRYARSKTTRDGHTVYDNGVEVWDGEPESGILKTYRIPRDALYTGMIHYVAPGEYQRIWTHETGDGRQIICFTDGPEKTSGLYLFYETEKSYVLVSLGWNDVAVIEEIAEGIDWTRFDE